jgi:hypothetical protein
MGKFLSVMMLVVNTGKVFIIKENRPKGRQKNEMKR